MTLYDQEPKNVDELFDVIAVNYETKRVRLIAEGKTERNAEAIIDMAVLRRGVEEEFFDTAPARQYHDGDLLGERPA